MDENNWVVVDCNVDVVCRGNFDKVGDQAIAVTKIMQITSIINGRDVIFFISFESMHGNWGQYSFTVA